MPVSSNGRTVTPAEYRMAATRVRRLFDDCAWSALRDMLWREDGLLSRPRTWNVLLAPELEVTRCMRHPGIDAQAEALDIAAELAERRKR